MRKKTYLRFLIAYLLFAFLSLFTMASFSLDLVKGALLEQEAEVLHREGTVLSSRYGEEVFSEDAGIYAVENELESYSTLMGASLWVVNRDGEVLAESGAAYTRAAPEVITAYDATASTSPSYMCGDFYGLMDEEVLTVSCPVTNGFRTLGYVLIHEPTTAINAQLAALSHIGLLTFAIIFVFSLLIFAAYVVFIQWPLRRVLTAAREYAGGNLGYQIDVERHDEIGHLSMALNDMSRRLNESEEDQKKFIANVSHDFRSPLTSIKGYVEALRDGTIPPEMADKYLGVISFETDRLTDLTEDLLTLSSYDLQGVSLNPEVFDLNEVIKSAASSFEGRCVKNHIEFELLFAAHETPVKADKAKMRQVFYNLLDNAVKFSPENSTITVETTMQGNKLRISVRDKGEGIAAADLPHIWERFYKGDASRGRDKKGTGLGLSIVKEILTAHGEAISVISTRGSGTEFTFSLPRG